MKLEHKNSTTNRLSEIDNNGKKINYTYDANGNIETITRDGKRIKYYYNELNEVYREDNQILNKTILYTYDLGGNILSKVEYPYTEGVPENPTKTITYTYDDFNWKDKLTSFDGKTITYDAIGNPLTYDGYTFTWEEGRQLARIQGNGLNISYKYNDQGIRTEKTVNGVTTKYYLLGDKVILETNGLDTIHYSYDSQDNLVSMNLNGVEYYYVRNGQGDIIALIDANGNEAVSYTYDSWGNVVSIDGSLKDTVGVKNPYRYRGYRYDEETKLYYLQSRYYNPEWGRFVNADAIAGNDGELLTHNLYVYAQNNPVVKFDPSGFIWETIFDVVNIGISTAEFVKNPSLRNAEFLAWYIGAVVLPGAPGSYVGKGLNVSGKIDDIGDTSKIANKISKDSITTRRQTFRAAKRASGIPTSAQFKTHKFVHDIENRIVYEFNVAGKKKYIIEHLEDRFGRGPHFHGADDIKGSPFNK